MMRTNLDSHELKDFLWKKRFFFYQGKFLISTKDKTKLEIRRVRAWIRHSCLVGWCNLFYAQLLLYILHMVDASCISNL